MDEAGDNCNFAIDFARISRPHSIETTFKESL